MSDFFGDKVKPRQMKRLQNKKERRKIERSLEECKLILNSNTTAVEDIYYDDYRNCKKSAKVHF